MGQVSLSVENDKDHNGDKMCLSFCSNSSFLNVENVEHHPNPYLHKLNIEALL